MFLFLVNWRIHGRLFIAPKGTVNAVAPRCANSYNKVELLLGGKVPVIITNLRPLVTLRWTHKPPPSVLPDRLRSPVVRVRRHIPVQDSDNVIKSKQFEYIRAWIRRIIYSPS
jgi:hypothetical protein